MVLLEKALKFSIIIYSCALSIIFYGLLKIQSGEMLIGEMVSFLLYMAYLSAPVRGFLRKFNCNVRLILLQPRGLKI